MVGNSFKIGLATVCGGAVGYQREVVERPAGFRTHVLVCMGAALVMLVSVYPFADYAPQADPSRIAAQVVIGIGFIGAGTIIRQGDLVWGLTTAASLWAIAGVGLAIGIGFYTAGLTATVLILLVLVGFKYFEKTVIGSKQQSVLKVTIKDQPGQLGKVGTALGKLRVNIQGIDMNAQEMEDEAVLNLTLDIPKDVSSEDVMEEASRVEGVIGVEWESQPKSRRGRNPFLF